MNPDDERDAVILEAMTICAVQSQAVKAVTGTEFNHVLVRCRLKPKQYKHLPKERSDLLRQVCNVTLTQELEVPVNQCQIGDMYMKQYCHE